MKRIARLLFPLLCLPCFAQVAVTPATIPHITFVNASGGPCAGCTLGTFSAGTTTPLASYTDSSGTSQNTNPIVLDAAGGANIWLGNNSYKLVLKDSLGTTIWTVDQVKGGGGSGGLCGPAGAIQIANSAVNGLTCDATITVNTVTHTINIGTMPLNHVTIGALGTPTLWTFDTTSPTTALASLGALGDGAGTNTPDQLALSTGASHVITYSTAIPAGITAITASPNDNSTKPATTAYVAAPGAINPTSVQVSSGVAMTDNQGNGAKVQHSTGTTATDNCAKFDASGNVVDSGASCSAGTPRTCNANGCYRIEADGTIEAWGKTTGASGGTAGTVTGTFPFSFTTTTDLQVVISETGEPAGDGNPHPASCHISSGPTTTGFSAAIALATQVGGSGYDHLTGQVCSWHAYGH